MDELERSRKLVSLTLNGYYSADFILADDQNFVDCPGTVSRLQLWVIYKAITSELEFILLSASSTITVSHVSRLRGLGFETLRFRLWSFDPHNPHQVTTAHGGTEERTDNKSLPNVFTQNGLGYSCV